MEWTSGYYSTGYFAVWICGLFWHIWLSVCRGHQTEISCFREQMCDVVSLVSQSHRTVGSLWRESGLNWTDFLPEGEDVQAFISQQVGFCIIVFY